LAWESLGKTAALIVSSWTMGVLVSCDEPVRIIRLSEAHVDPTTVAPSSRHEPGVSDEDLNPRLLRRFAAITPAATHENPARVALGRVLYFEPLLSRTGLISCNSCHPLESYGATANPVAVGVAGRRGARNAPSTYNVGGHFRMFWDGRAATLEDQVRGPLESHDEMDMSAKDVVRRIDAIPGYAPLFVAAFPGEGRVISIENVSRAIAVFERGLVTPARWDSYLNGERDALSPAEKAGAKLFANVGCMVCHTGPLLGAATFGKLGVRAEWPEQPDRGRRNVSGNGADDLQFKVPSLRNVARTAPYFHDGSVTDLGDAVVLMARHQLGLEPLPEEVEALVTFLGCLTGELPVSYIAPPELPSARRP
jgi:cytochrome c peroxidase